MSFVAEVYAIAVIGAIVNSLVVFMIQIYNISHNLVISGTRSHIFISRN